MSEPLIDRADGVVKVTFNRPEKKNPLGRAEWNALEQALDEVGSNPEYRVLVITGAGGNFSSGADLSGGGLGGNSQNGSNGMIHDMRNFGNLAVKLHRLPKPTIALVDGVCVGVAMGVALGCDLIVAGEKARFGSLFVKRGLAIDGGVSWSLPRVVGLRRAKQMTFFGEMVNAQDAQAWGMVNEVVPSEELQAFGDDWAGKLAQAPTTAISLIKQQLDSSFNTSFSDAIENESRVQHIASTTADMAEGIKAYMEKREPRFTGR